MSLELVITARFSQRQQLADLRLNGFELLQGRATVMDDPAETAHGVEERLIFF